SMVFPTSPPMMAVIGFKLPPQLIVLNDSCSPIETDRCATFRRRWCRMMNESTGKTDLSWSCLC
uniref:Uncharacterized protein n=1 Tax=Oreochromis niloticus TaxID=8128 RepID=A0A669DFP1_ORENI